jgi:hypothetical protein
MIEETLILLAADYGFPAFVVLILLFDKLKTNNSLKKTVDNNTIAITQLQQYVTERCK